MREPRPRAGRESSLKQIRREGLKGVFARYVKMMREMKGLSQETAAKEAGMSRVQWNRIENAHDLPQARSIPGIADALDIYAEGLYKRAGYPIPKYEQFYDMGKAKREFVSALMSCKSLGEFVLRIGSIWQEYQMDSLKTNQLFKAERDYNQILAHVTRLTSRKRMELAEAILKMDGKSGSV